MRTSLLICATCLLVAGSCSAQFRLPSLSSALSSLTGFGGSSSNSNGAQSAAQSALASAASSSPYSSLVRDYGRNLMTAMSSIYPTLFKPPQSQSQQQPQQSQQQQQVAPSPFDQFTGGQQSQSLFGGGGGQSGPSFSFGGSTFSISPSFPFGSLSGAQQPQQIGSASAPSGVNSHSPFSGSFGSSINSPPSFGPLSSSPFLQQSMPSFAPATSYSAAYEAANGGPGSSQQLNSAMFGQNPGSLGNGPSGAQIMSQQSQVNPISSYSPMSSGGFSGQHDSSAQILAQPSHHQPQSAAPMSQSPSGLGMHQQSQQPQQAQQSPFMTQAQPMQGQQLGHMGQQYANSQQFRPDMMSIAASAPVPSSNSYSNYGSVPAQQGPSPSSSSAASSASVASASSYQQPSYR